VRAWIEAHPDRVPVVAPLLVLLARANESEFVLEWLDAVDPDDAPRLSAGLAALAYLPGEEAIERLAGAAASTSPRMHADGVEALALRWVGERDDVSLHAFFLEIFSRALRGDNARAAYAAAAALSDSVLQPLGGVDTLVAAYRRMRAPDDLEPMLSIVGSLDIAGSPAAETLLRETLGHPHPVLRRAAAQALASLIVRGVLPQTAGAPLPRPPGSDAAPAGLDGADHTRIDWAYLAELGPRPRLVLETERGRVALHLVTEDAPHTVQTIARLVEAGRYDGSTFHRVPPNFVAQGGDFERGDGFGGPGFTITTELNLVPFLRGVIGMASAGKDTEGSQFFITHSMQPHLDGGYTTFGWVVEGMEVVDLIAAGDRVVRASIERGG
jgi:peptidylprolyl isomerase